MIETHGNEHSLPLLDDTHCLKWDRFGERLGDLINFREVDGVFGLGQPSIEGLTNLLRRKLADPTEIIWTNLREEPVIYIQGKSFSVRAKDNLTDNLAYPGISSSEVEVLEDQLKADLVRRIEEGEGVTYYTEEKNGMLGTVTIPAESIEADHLRTVRDVFEERQREFPSLNYTRIPVTDEKRPEDRDFDALVARFRDCKPRAAYVMNCQGGFGRTTTAMAIMSVMKNATHEPARAFSIIPGILAEIREAGKRKRSSIGLLKSASRIAEIAANLIEVKAETIEDFKRVLQEQGVKVSHLINSLDERSSIDPVKACSYLERYVYLAVFGRYCVVQGPGGYKVPFSSWVKTYERRLRLLLSTLYEVCKLRKKL
jgi:hypothetical protein